MMPLATMNQNAQTTQPTNDGRSGFLDLPTQGTGGAPPNILSPITQSNDDGLFNFPGLPMESTHDNFSGIPLDGVTDPWPTYEAGEFLQSEQSSDPSLFPNGSFFS
ncbi:unnamed protein product [Cercospora beticola]|nr:unnamed protein product [Cercospora beticola]